VPHPDVPHPDATYPDADDLALVALGETLDADMQRHIAGCSDCTEQIETFRSTIDLAGLSDYGRAAPAPGEHVWDAIADELGFARLDRTAEDEPAAASDEPAPSIPLPTAPPTPPPTRLPTAGPGGRWQRWAAPIAAAVVGVALGAGGLILVQNRGDAVTVEATAPLDPVAGGPLPPTEGRLGTAELVTARSGELVRVDATGLPATTGTAYEVWLFGHDGRMVSLGALADGTGSFTVPAGIDTSEYRTVDISDELPDGNPAHSGISLARGTFT
jgi:hypothetical protein